jgi:hypothetical protein
MPDYAEYEPAPEAVAIIEPSKPRSNRQFSGRIRSAPDETVDAEEVSLRLVPQNSAARRDFRRTAGSAAVRGSPPAWNGPRSTTSRQIFWRRSAAWTCRKTFGGGLGPRDGALAFFIHRRNYDLRVLHLRDTGIPVAPPFTLNDPEGWFGPQGGLGFGDLAPFAVRAFPEWPVDLVTIRPGDADPRSERRSQRTRPRALRSRLRHRRPAFHPFDWGSMTAMVALLETRLDRLMTEAAPPPGAGAEDIAEMEGRAAINREARTRAEEIIAIVHDSAVRDAFSAADATAVMAGLHAIHWVKAIRTIDPETGTEQVETITLPLTTHRTDANLWVHDYQTILFDSREACLVRQSGQSVGAGARLFRTVVARAGRPRDGGDGA